MCWPHSVGYGRHGVVLSARILSFQRISWCKMSFCSKHLCIVYRYYNGLLIQRMNVCPYAYIYACMVLCLPFPCFKRKNKQTGNELNFCVILEQCVFCSAWMFSCVHTVKHQVTYSACVRACVRQPWNRPCWDVNPFRLQQKWQSTK